MLNAQPDASGQIAAIGIVTGLVAFAQDVQRILSFDYLLHQVGHHVGHGQPHIAAHDFAVAHGPFFANSNAVKRARDRIGQLVLLVCALHEELGGQLLEPVSRTRRRTTAFGAFRGRELAGALEHHAGRDDCDLPELAFPMGPDSGIKSGSGDALVFRQQIIRKLMKVRNAANHGCCSNEVIAFGYQFLQQSGILGIALDEGVMRMAVIGFLRPAIFAEIIQANNFMSGFQQLFNEIAANKPGGAGDKNLHRAWRPAAVATVSAGWRSCQKPQMSTICFPWGIASVWYTECGAPKITMSERRMASSRGTKSSSLTKGSVHKTSLASSASNLRSL